jgi:hypothetical protein
MIPALGHPQLEDASLVEAERLRDHVQALAGEIGERNVFHPEALQAAADYIRRHWSAQDYPVSTQAYEVEGVPCENLEVNRGGRGRPGEIILIGAHYGPGKPRRQR